MCDEVEEGGIGSSEPGGSLIDLLGVASPWPWQLRALESGIKHIDSRSKVVMSAPTGAGKSVIFLGLIRYATARGIPVAVYCCRNLLLQQLIATCQKQKIPFGVRAAQFKQYRDVRELVQLCSLDTVYASFRNDINDIPKAGVVIVDEAHQQKQGKAEKIFNAHVDSGAALIGFSATPAELDHLYDAVEQVCYNSEMRDPALDFPAHLPATVYGCPEMDVSNLKPLKTGEFSINQIRKEVWTPQIFGHVYKHYVRLNPDGKPALLFAPGVKESKWFCDMLNAHGVAAAHIDGEDCYVDGVETKTNPEKREEIVQRLKDGDIKVVCNRFVMREGIDIPELYHLILATPIGSLVSYVQVVGRVLRNHPSLEKVIIQDHAGNFWRHGSPNEDRDWTDYFKMTANQVSQERVKQIQEGEIKNPILCPNCHTVRASGSKCPTCGFEHSKTRRMVIQRDGSLRPIDYEPFRKIVRQEKDDTLKIWNNCYWRCRKSNRTFNQAMALFRHENNYWPPNDLPNMPREGIDWYERISRVPKERLYQ